MAFNETENVASKSKKNMGKVDLLLLDFYLATLIWPEKLDGVEVLVVNALRIEPHPSHLHLDASERC